MNKPVFRLELLQYVLGLDCRFTLDVLRAAMALALECAEEWALQDAEEEPAARACEAATEGGVAAEVPRSRAPGASSSFPTGPPAVRASVGT